MNRSRLTDIGLLIARVGFGGYMAMHGWGKAQLVIAGKFDGFADPIGLGEPVSLVLAALAEFVCALLVVVGLGTRLAAIPIIFTMIVAAFLVHGNDPWTAGGAHKLFEAGETAYPVSREPALLFLFAFLTLLLTGPGKLSLDAALWPKLRSRKRAAAAA